MRFGKDITYVRDPKYWARDLPVRRGTANFDRITVKIYKDGTARLEALKAGEFDLMRFFSAGDWARRVNGKRFDTGELVKAEFHPQAAFQGFQSYVLNTRRPPMDDIRVREALGLALDYEWMNRQMFYGGYQRVQGLFGNTDCAADGSPGPAELALLEPWRKQLPPAVFGPVYRAPRTDGSDSLRGNLRKAQALLREAGWTVRDGALRNAKGQAMVLEYLDSQETGARTVTPWSRNLEKLGVELKFRPVDFALYQQRLQTFNFEITSAGLRWHPQPGTGIRRPFREQGGGHRRLGQHGRREEPGGRCADRAHDRSGHPARIPGRLPCTGTRDHFGTATIWCRSGLPAPTAWSTTPGGWVAQKPCPHTPPARTGRSIPGGASPDAGRTQTCGPTSSNACC